MFNPLGSLTASGQPITAATVNRYMIEQVGLPIADVPLVGLRLVIAGSTACGLAEGFVAQVAQTLIFHLVDYVVLDLRQVRHLGLEVATFEVNQLSVENRSSTARMATLTSAPS
jgi:hypothetical protein